MTQEQFVLRRLQKTGPKTFTQKKWKYDNLTMTQHNTPVATAPVQTANGSVTPVPLLFTTLSPIKCFHTLLGVNEHCTVMLTGVFVDLLSFYLLSIFLSVCVS